MHNLSDRYSLSLKGE